MTIQSLAWALDQDIPGAAKLVLIALANRADDETGLVNFDAAATARVAVVKAAGVPRYLAALERNGYLDRDEAADGRRYYLVLDRESGAPWSWDTSDRQGLDAAPDDDAADTESAPTEVASPRRTDGAPAKFSRARQAEARQSTAPAKSESTPHQVPVIEGSDAARAWAAHDRAHGRVTPFVSWITLKDGRLARGFYKPILFPPRQERIENLEGVA